MGWPRCGGYIATTSSDLFKLLSMFVQDDKCEADGPFAHPELLWEVQCALPCGAHRGGILQGLEGISCFGIFAGRP